MVQLADSFTHITLHRSRLPVWAYRSVTRGLSSHPVAHPNAPKVGRHLPWEAGRRAEWQMGGDFDSPCEHGGLWRRGAFSLPGLFTAGSDITTNLNPYHYIKKGIIIIRMRKH